ncbi:MAG: 1-deoxy-D-xylulose-5-phosphate reductoisomerase [Burkholderiales bacterium]|nr:1-deoxy-D-xylulose-5-phosphate reductoisomerase [Burkholderiales bacterium]
MQSLTILGATGSIGLSTLDVVSRHPQRFRVFALTAHRQAQALGDLCLRFAPRYAVLADAGAAAALQQRLAQAGCATEVLAGERALVEVAAHGDVDTVMAAIVGAAGLAPALAAARAGKRILLANKESLVMAGDVFLAACRAGGAAVLPIDSEHNAIFQCLPETARGLRGSGAAVPGEGAAGGQTAYGEGSPPAAALAGVRRILLTASGGPFRQASLAEMEEASPEQACAHPNWSMGRKISVDSATMMNKGLELIEAFYLFGLPGPQLDVVVHPQSIIHSMVEYEDGSVLAQLGHPDMRTPIAHALAHPQRIASGVSPLSLAAIGRLDFEAPDLQRFPCLRLAHEALDGAGAAPCVLNAANEIAVAAFLAGELRFTDIAQVNDSVLQVLGSRAAGRDVDEVFAIDDEARALARRQLMRCAA